MQITLEILPPPSRLDQLLLQQLRESFPHLSRAVLKTAFQEKRILFRGRPVKASLELGPGKYEIEIQGAEKEFAETAPAQASLQGSFLPVLYEDEKILVLNKRSGIPSVPHSSEETETAVGSALAHLHALSGIGPRALEPGLLHRLDTGTSGALVFAKTETEFERLRTLWSTGQVRKIYRALAAPQNSETPFPALPLDLQLSLAHDAHSTKRMIVLQRSHQSYRGKPLSTITRLVALHSDPNTSGALVDVEIQIQTGVMHQIRCTLAHLGFPILGDATYGGRECRPQAPRLFLHAWKLEIPSALPGEKPLCIEAPLPEEWFRKN